MGSCFSQEGRRRHERLYERYDDYFFELEKQDSVKEKNSKWLDNEIGSSTRTATIQGSSEQFAPNRQNSLEDHWTLQSTSTFDYSFSFATLSQPDNFTHRRIMPQKLENVGARYGKCHPKQKGHALQLRLAKHHFLQMAVTSQISTPEFPITPVTIDSSFFTEDSDVSLSKNKTKNLMVSSPTIIPTSLLSKPKPKDGDLIWKEISCEQNVTAMAMNRISVGSSSFQSNDESIGPLILAMGDEKGKYCNTLFCLILDVVSGRLPLNGRRVCV